MTDDKFQHSVYYNNTELETCSCGNVLALECAPKWDSISSDDNVTSESDPDDFYAVDFLDA